MTRIPRPAVACIFLSVLFPCLHARVGETQQALESRLLSSPAAAREPPQDLVVKRDRGANSPIENEYTEELGTIVRPDGGTVISPIKIMELMPPGADVDTVFYLKSDTGRPTGINVISLRNWTPDRRFRPGEKDKDNPVLGDTLNNLRTRFTGWELMVIYVNKVAELEVYRRLNSYITPAELEGILTRNGGTGAWKKVAKDSRADSLMPYDYETNDGKLRARLVLNGTNMTAVIVYNAQMADALRQAQVTRKQQQQAERDISKSLDLF